MNNLGLSLLNIIKIAPFILGVLDPDTLIAVITTYNKKNSKSMEKEQVILINCYREHVQKQIEYMTCALIAWSMAIGLCVLFNPRSSWSPGSWCF